MLAPNSTVTGAEFLVAVEAEDRRDQKAPLVRIASAMEPEWLLDLFPERVREVARTGMEPRRRTGGERRRPCCSMRIAIETRRGRARPEAAGALLARQGRGGRPGALRRPRGDRSAFRARVTSPRSTRAVPPLDDAAIEAALRALATGLRSFAELAAATRDGGLLRALEQSARHPARGCTRRGRAGPHPPGRRPRRQGALRSRISRPGSPRACRISSACAKRRRWRAAQVPVVVRLLAPNQRPVQMTTDLAGFWQRLYPQVRRELSRRYPRHAWPEDPLA